MKFNKYHVYKIRKLINNEKILFFYTELTQFCVKNKKNLHLSISKQGFNCYNIQHISSKILLEKTLLRHFGFLFIGSLYIVKPNKVKFENIEKTFVNKAKFAALKINNKIYFKKTEADISSFHYRKESLLLTCFLNKFLYIFSDLCRNNVN